MTSGHGGNLLGGLLGGGQGAGQSGGGGLGDMLGSALAGGGSSSSGGLGDMLGSALGGGGAGGGGLNDLLGGMLGGGGSRGGAGSGLGGALGGVAMAALLKYAAGKMSGSGGSSPDLSGMLGSDQQAGGSGLGLMDFDTPEMNNQAELLIEAMINAAKADGRVDANEEQAILQRLGELDADEIAFVKSKLHGPVDAAGFAARVPANMAREVYATSLLAVELDERSEALYLRDLAQGLGLDAATCNAVHQQMGAPQIFR